MLTRRQSILRGRFRCGVERLSMAGLLVLVGLMGGCAFIRGEVEPFSEDRIKALEKGKTTRQEVALQFGAPDEVV
ncbi:MAG: hypothetical protein P8X46_13985, partial [Nitrospirales bacterium]